MTIPFDAFYNMFQQIVTFSKKVVLNNPLRVSVLFLGTLSLKGFCEMLLLALPPHGEFSLLRDILQLLGLF